MSMVDYLMQHARDNVWCMPFQDRQSILKLSRLTKDGGERGYVDALWDSLALPNKTDMFHVYQIGQNHPQSIGLPSERQKWFALQEWGALNSQVINLYADNGISYPLSMAYIYRADDYNFLVAVKIQQWRSNYTPVLNLDTQPLYLRLYRNAYYFSDTGSQLEHKVEYGGGLVDSATRVNKILSEVTTYRRRNGLVNLYWNGVWVNDVDANNVKVGDFLEYCYDASVARVVDFKVNNLYDFESELDAKRKYLLHPAKGASGQTIRYRDDVDVFVYVQGADGKLSGRYYHRNMENSLRMLTHADYSIPVDYVRAYWESGTWATEATLHIRLQIRDAGLDRPLILESHRINELYRLSDNDIVRAMVGIDSTLDEWQAASLEKSLYTAIMRSYYGPEEVRDVLEAYGYNAVSRLVTPSPLTVQTSGTDRFVTVGYGQLQACTMLEYDKDGLLLGFYQHSGGERYYVVNAACTLVEVQVGIGQKQLDWHQGNNAVDTTGYNFETYYCNKVKDVPDLVWKKAVEGVNYQLVGNVVTWIHSTTKYEGLVVTDKNFLLYTSQFSALSAVYTFDITHTNSPGTALSLQPGRLQLFLNGHPIIENLDYRMGKFPQLTLTSTKYLNVGGTNVMTVMGTGFVGETMTRDIPTDVGFAYGGYISSNNHYDVRDDKVMHLVVGGGVKDPAKAPYAERYGQSGLFPVPNGTPYASYQVHTPIRGISDAAQRALRNAAKDFDKRLEDYLTWKRPQPVIPGPSPITDFYPLYSPFFTRLVYELEQGHLTSPYTPEDAMAVSAKVKPYVALLDVDPCRFDNNVNFTRIYPVPDRVMRNVSERDYRFLKQVNKLYLNNKLDLSNFFRIEG
jgi:hypothetical protein